MPSLIQWGKPVLLLWEEFLISWYFTGTHPHHRRIPMSDSWMWTLLRNKTQEVPFWSSVASMVKKSMTRDVKSKTTCLSACCAVMVWRSLKLARGMPPEYSNRSSLRNIDILVQWRTPHIWPRHYWPSLYNRPHQSWIFRSGFNL